MDNNYDADYNAKYNRQANAFARNAVNSYEKENPSMEYVTFDPYNRKMGASFKRNSNGSTLRYDDQDLNGSPNIYSQMPWEDGEDSGITSYNGYFDSNTCCGTDDSPEKGLGTIYKLTNFSVGTLSAS